MPFELDGETDGINEDINLPSDSFNGPEVEGQQQYLYLILDP